MYKITKTDGTELGVTDSVLYIKINDNKSYSPASAEEAVGIAYCNTAYNLIGYEEIAGAETVIISEVDAGQVFSELISYKALAKAYTEGVQNAE
ncbi:MAG: hypothetical protein E7635_07670 [Ruminococcaceae bacterium]|nr:hypothetical protein [Oscillospiraceae bacterium]